jgi:hypothetical protein
MHTRITVLLLAFAAFAQGQYRSSLPNEHNSEQFQGKDEMQFFIPNPKMENDTQQFIDQAFIEFCMYEPRPYKKIQVWDVTKPTRIVFEGMQIYEGGLIGHTPHGRGKVIYDKSLVAHPMPDAYAYKMITEGTFEKGKCTKIEKLYVDDFSGYFVKGNISVYSKPYSGKWDWNCTECTLYNYTLSGKEVVVFEGNYGMSAAYGKGRYYYSQYEGDPLEHAYVEIHQLKNGVAMDSLTLVIPEQNYRKTFVISTDPIYKYMPMENVGGFVYACYRGENPHPAHWKRGTPPPTPQPTPYQDNYDVLFAELSNATKKELDKIYVVQEGKVWPNGGTIEKTVHVELEEGRVGGVIIFTLNNVKPEIMLSNGETPYKYDTCVPFAKSGEIAAGVRVNTYGDCNVGNLSGKKDTFTFKISARNANEPIYYMLLKSL